MEIAHFVLQIRRHWRLIHEMFFCWWGLITRNFVLPQQMVILISYIVWFDLENKNAYNKSYITYEKNLSYSLVYIDLSKQSFSIITMLNWCIDKLLNDIGTIILHLFFSQDYVVGINTKSRKKTPIKLSWNPSPEDWIK